MKAPVKGSPEQKHSTGTNVNPNVNQLDAEAEARFDDKFGLPIGGGKFSDVHLSYIAVADEIRSHIAKEKELSYLEGVEDARLAVCSVEKNTWEKQVYLRIDKIFELLKLLTLNEIKE